VKLIRGLLIVSVMTAPAHVAHGQVQMPDPSQMSGVPLPSPELPAGTLTVRVVRESLANNIPNQKVTLSAGGATREATTDASGRAEFTGLRPGDRVKASTSVDGAAIESQTITMPAQGGVRVMLFAGGAAARARAAEDARLRAGPAQPGAVVLGGQSRFIVERGDEVLNVFYVLEIVNTARTPVDPGAPLIFDLPSGARGVTLLEGTTDQATAGGTRVTVTGPFAPGTTPLQIAFELPHRGARAVIEQKLPASLPQLAAAGETTGGVTFTSPLFTASRDMNSDGRTFLVGNGAAIPAGGTLRLEFDGLPHHARWPRFGALGVALAIVAAGLFFGFARRPAAPQSARDTLERQRDARFAELDALEQARAAGTLTPDAYTAARRDIVASLEDIYAGLDGQRG
jgi:hypothetical protein